MKKAAFFSLFLLVVACGGTEADEPTELDDTEAAVGIPSCPKPVLPAAGSCANNEVYPVRRGNCLVAFRCKKPLSVSTTCPRPILPECKSGSLTAVKDAQGCTKYVCGH